MVDIIQDGGRVRVPLTMMDGAAKHYGLYPLGGNSKEGDACTIYGRAGTLKRVEGGYLCEPLASDSVVRDGLGRPSGSRPGHCYLHATGVDHAVHVTRQLNSFEAFSGSVAELQDAWRGNNNDREVAHLNKTGDATRDAYLDSVSDLENAWHRGTGKR